MMCGCMPVEESARLFEGRGHTIGRFYSTVEKSDSTSRGPTWRGEKESTEKQKRVVTTILVVSAIALFIASLAWLGADR